MKRWLWLVSCCVVMWTSASRAQESQRGHEALRETSRFSAGAGVGYAADGLGGLGLIGGSGLAGLAGLTNARASVPFGTAVLEAALTPRLRLGLGAMGGYTKTTYRDDGDMASGAALVPGKTGFASASLGLRWILNPEDVVQISPLITAGGGFGVIKDSSAGSLTDAETGETVQLWSDVESHGFEGRLALVLEYRLLPQLFLRFESYFARASYTKSTETIETGADETRKRISQTSLNFGWLPVLQLRLTF